MQHELIKRVERLGDDFFQTLTNDIGDDGEDDEGFSAAENYSLSVISLVSDKNNPQDSIAKKRYQTLKGHTPTRWHSILIMLESLDTQRLAVSRTLYRMSSTHSISEMECELIQNLIQFLKIFRSAVEIFSFDRKPTISCTLVFRAEIENALKPNSKDHAVIAKLKKNMAEKIDLRFPITDEILIAAILDPRLSNLPIVARELDRVGMSKFEFVKSQLLKLPPISEESPEPSVLPQPEIQSKSKKPPSLLSTLIEKHAYSQSTTVNFGEDDRALEEEIHKYFITQIGKEDIENFDILQFWKNNSKSLPKLARLAKKILCIPATSVSSERAFSYAGILISAKRSSLGPSVIDKTLFLHDNYSLIKRTVFANS